MNSIHSRPIDILDFTIENSFRQPSQELVRKLAVPHQSRASNDSVMGADSSFSLHGFGAQDSQLHGYPGLEIVDSHDCDLPNDLAYSETCASIALALFARRVLQIKPHAEYYDVMESAPCNMVLAGMVGLAGGELGMSMEAGLPWEGTCKARLHANGPSLRLLHVDMDEVGGHAKTVSTEGFEFAAGNEKLSEHGQGHVDPVWWRMVRLLVPAWRKPARWDDPSQWYRTWRPCGKQKVTAVLIFCFAGANGGANEMRVFSDNDHVP